MKRTSSSLALAFVLAASCGAGAALAETAAPYKFEQTSLQQASQERGRLINVEPLGTMSQERLGKIAAWFPGGITARTSAELYRVTYWTALKGKPTKVSGLLSVPVGVDEPKGVMMYLRGTNTTRRLGPTEPGRSDGTTEAAVFTGNGYYVLVPDYIGMGVSTLPQSYVLTEPQVDTSIDMLKAFREYSLSRVMPWSPDLVMMGFSQGGQTVAGVHRALEREGLADYTLRGSIGIAGPYELRETSLPKALVSGCVQCVGYLAWVTSAYAAHYGRDATEAMKPKYAALVPKLFDGRHELEEIGGALPQNPEDLFQPEFLATLKANGDNWLTKALDENETYRWAPVAPIRLYFGEKDLDVPASSSRAFYNYAKPRGGNVSLHSQGNVDHMASSSMTYAPALAWFDELVSGS
jgi:hypothetical protein